MDHQQIHVGSSSGHQVASGLEPEPGGVARGVPEIEEELSTEPPRVYRRPFQLSQAGSG